MLTELFAALGALATICTAYGVLRGNMLKIKGDMPVFIIDRINRVGGDWHCLHLRIYHGNVYIHFKKVSTNALAIGQKEHYELEHSPFRLAALSDKEDKTSSDFDLPLAPNNACPTSELRVLFKPRKSQRTLRVSFHVSWNFFAAKQTITADISRHTD